MCVCIYMLCVCAYTCMYLHMYNMGIGTRIERAKYCKLIAVAVKIYIIFLMKISIIQNSSCTLHIHVTIT